MAIWTLCPDDITFLCKFWHFQMAVSCLLLGLFTPNLGILKSLVCTLWLCGSIVANPIMYRHIPNPSLFEIRQWNLTLCFVPQMWSLKIFQLFSGHFCFICPMFEDFMKLSSKIQYQCRYEPGKVGTHFCIQCSECLKAYSCIELIINVLTILGSCYCSKQINISFLYICPLINDKFHHNIVKVYCKTTHLRLLVPINQF